MSKKTRKKQARKKQTRKKQAAAKPAEAPSNMAAPRPTTVIDIDGMMAEPINAPPPAVEAEENAKPTFSFPSRTRCPRCKGLYNLVVSTQGGYRYYRCKHAICRATWRVAGTPV